LSQTAIMVVVAIVILCGIVLVFAMSRRSRLRKLPDESRDRYSRSWHGVETQFIDDPSAAVREADRIVVTMLGERGATLHDERRVPEDLRRARAAASSDEGRQGTEGLRKAMVHYKRMVEAGIGSPSSARKTSRREVA
jgi:hypothetical protein